MIKHTIKSAIRHLWKNKAFSLINLVGLVIGLLASFCIASYLFHESSYDKNHPGGEHTYRLLSLNTLDDGDKSLSAINFLPITRFVEESVPEVEALARVENVTSATLVVGEETFIEKNFVWADASLLRLLDIKFLRGNPDEALMDPNTAIITEREALRFFGAADPIGQLIKVNSQELTVKGIIANPPSNMHLKARLIGSINTFKNLNDPWSHQGYVYAKLNALANPAEVAAKINAAMVGNVRWVTNIPTYQLQKIQDVHLYSTNVGQSPNAINVKYLYIFGFIGLILIFSTAFNYIGLSVANFAARTREFGVRKIMGSSKTNLVLQPFMECLLLCSLAALIALMLMSILLPAINSLLGSEMDKTFFLSLPNLVLLLLVCVVLLALSAIYPAFLVFRFRPVSALRKGTMTVWKGIGIRKPLMVLQFAIAIALVVSVIVIQRQLDFLSKERLGFDKEQVLVLKTPRFSKINAPLMKERLSQLSAVDKATVAVGTPFGGGFSHLVEDVEHPYTVSEFYVDADYAKTLGMHIVEGRDLSALDSNKVLVNEAMVRKMGWEQAIGQTLKFYGQPFEVLGVVGDFQLNNTQTPIHPVAIALGKEDTNNILLRLETKNLAEGLAQVNEVWKETEPNHPLDYMFLDEQFNKLFQSEIQFQHLSKLFSFIAILIACLGLYGAIVLAAQQRVKEIGIRKVLGASVSGIVSLLSKDFLKLVVIAMVIASPIAWWAMNRWLEDFAYRIEVQWWMFAVAGLAAVVIALLTVGYQAIRAAVANPVESLRDE